VLATLFGLALGQQTCVYEVSNGPNRPPFVLNLTAIQTWTLELEENGINYYYTPCRNGLRCFQGNSEFFTNVAQFKVGVNQCIYYLGVDHHERPTYSQVGASYRFEYEDGEMCQQTNQPRRTTIYYQCAENAPFTARLLRAQEVALCDYHLTIESPLACIPENTQNAACKFNVRTPGAQTLHLDLSPLADINPLRFVEPNGYRFYYSPCRNGLNCYQQPGPRLVMAELDNVATGTCELWTAEWENGRHQPYYLASEPETFQFRFYNGEPCNNGQIGSEQVINFMCNRTVETAQVVNATRLATCRYAFNIATKLACVSSM